MNALRHIYQIIAGLILLIGLVGKAQAQTYPVQSSVSLTPPYSTFLTDYTRPEAERLAATFLLRDIARPELAVKLRLRLEGPGVIIQTKPTFQPAPIYLQGGVPLRLSGAEMAEYFQPENLSFQGINAAEFVRRGQALPQGMYRFKIEVLEYNRGVKISNTGEAIGWLLLNDPPLVNLPARSEIVRYQQPQQVVLQWTPRHLGSPNGAFTTEYEVTLTEVWPEGRNPQEAMRTVQPLYQATTTATQLVYGPAEPFLEAGRVYAWRVQARAQAGGVILPGLFKNEGFSETYHFQYGEACTAVNNVTAEALAGARIKIKWDAAANHNEFTVRYRPYNEEEEGEWYEKTNILPEVTLSDLTIATRYEFMVSGNCGQQSGGFTAADTLSTRQEEEIAYMCGLPVGEVDLSNQQLLESLQVGDVVDAGDFRVYLTEVSGTSSFSGTGVVEVPFLNKAKVGVSFSNIKVNNEYRLVTGKMNLTGGKLQVIPEGVLDAVDQLDETLDNVDNVLAQGAEALDMLDNIITQYGDLVNDLMDNGPLTDAEEEEYVNFSVAEYQQAAVAYAAQAATNMAAAGTEEQRADAARDAAKAVTLVNRAKKLKQIHNNSDTVKVIGVEFIAAQNGGFDERFDPAHRLHYNILVTPDNQAHAVPWISSEVGKTTTAVARLVENSGLNADNIIFHYGESQLSAGRNGNQWEVSLPAVEDKKEIDVLAIDNSTGDIVGRLSVVGYQLLPRTVNLVAVNGASLSITKDEVQRYLNEVYGSAAATWTVNTAESLTVEGFSGTLQDDEQALLSTYSEGMRDIIKVFQASRDYSKEEFYLFLVPNSQQGRAGYMPRKHRYGFIFTQSGGNKNITIAHELGHGAFRLQHTKEEYPTLPAITGNLMDSIYSGGHLAKHQWDQIHNPPIVIGLVEDMDEGGLPGIHEIPEDFRNADGTMTFISPAGKLVVLPKEARRVAFYLGFSSLETSYPVIGTLHSFIIGEKTYAPKLSSEGIFDGYLSGEEKYQIPQLVDTLKNSILSNVVMVMPNTEGISLLRFSVGNVPLEDWSNGEFVSERDFPLALYAEDKLLISKQYTLDNQTEARYGDTRSITDISTTSLIEPALNTPAILSAYKAAILRAVYSGYIEFFDNNYIGGQLPEAVELRNLKDSDYTEYSHRYVEIFRDYISKYNVNTDEGYDFWVDHLKMLTYEEYQGLSLDTRVAYLKQMSAKTLYGDAEARVRNLIVTTPENQQKELLNKLVTIKDSKGNHMLLHTLTTDITGVDGNEFNTIVNTLVGWVFNHYPVPSDNILKAAIEGNIALEKNKKLIPYKEGFWTGYALTEYFTDDGKVVLKSRKQFSSGLIELNVDPYQYIILDIKEEIELGDRKVKGELKVPALFAYMLFNNENTKKLIKAGKITFDVAMLFVGVGEINAALQLGSKIRLYKALIDIGVAVTDFGISNVLEDDLQKSPAGKEILNVWSEITLYYGLVTITDAVLQSALNKLSYRVNKAVVEGNILDENGNVIKNLTVQDKNQLRALVTNLEQTTGLRAGEAISAEILVQKYNLPGNTVSKINDWNIDYLYELDAALSNSALKDVMAQDLELFEVWKIMKDSNMDFRLLNNPNVLQRAKSINCN